MVQQYAVADSFAARFQCLQTGCLAHMHLARASVGRRQILTADRSGVWSSEIHDGPQLTTGAGNTMVVGSYLSYLSVSVFVDCVNVL